MNWKEIISTLEKPDDLFYLSNLPATVEQIAELEQSLQVILPDEMREFYLQTNGITEELAGIGIIGYLVLPIERVIEDNLSFRSRENQTYLPFETLLLVSPNGFGDYYGYRVQDGKIITTDIIAWDHENDRRIQIAASLKELIEGRTKSTLNW